MWFAHFVWNWLIVPIVILIIIGDILLRAVAHKIKRVANK